MVRMKGETTVVGVVADAATGQVLGLEVLVKRDSDGFIEWLCDFARDCEGRGAVTDDLNTYKPMVERLGIDHQICTAYVNKWAWNRLDRIDGWDLVKARIWLLLTELPFDGDLELPRLERAIRDGDATLRRRRFDLPKCIWISRLILSQPFWGQLPKHLAHVHGEPRQDR